MMKNNLSHEFYKFAHRQIPLYGILVLLGLMFYTAGTSYKISPSLITQGFGAGQWAIIIIITISSDMIAMEYRNHTMATLMYKTSSKTSLFTAKFIVLVIYSAVLLILGTIFSFVIKALMVGSKYPWQQIYHGYSLLSALLINMCGTMVYLLFIITLSLMLILLIKNNATVIMIGLVIGFLGADLSDLAMSVFSGIKSILAWNPFNMINIITQLSDNKMLSVTHLTNSGLIIGNLIYSVIFFCIGLSVFKKQSI